MTSNFHQELRALVAQIEEGTYRRRAADILLTALEEGRLTNKEFVGVMDAFAQSEAARRRAWRDKERHVASYAIAMRELAASQYYVKQAMAWLHDPWVRPVFIFSSWVETALNWLFGLFRKNRSA